MSIKTRCLLWHSVTNRQSLNIQASIITADTINPREDGKTEIMQNVHTATHMPSNTSIALLLFYGVVFLHRPLLDERACVSAS